MTREDIIKMARIAGAHDNGHEVRFVEPRYLARFTALVAEAEREAICPIVYGLCVSDNNAQEIVNAIRARGSE
jgi:hypothetical protein